MIRMVSQRGYSGNSVTVTPGYPQINCLVIRIWAVMLKPLNKRLAVQTAPIVHPNIQRKFKPQPSEFYVFVFSTCFAFMFSFKTKFISLFNTFMMCRKCTISHSYHYHTVYYLYIRRVCRPSRVLL